MSRTSVTRARDCFAELLKRFSKDSVIEAASSLKKHGHGPESRSKAFLLVQVHDEAAMRVRSFVGSQSQTVLRGARSRYSSVQNQVVIVHAAGRGMDFATELVGLGRKNAASIAQAVLTTTLEVIGALLEGLALQREKRARLRLVHILTADGAPVNEAAAKKVLACMGRYRPAEISYSVLAFKCSAHQANLTVQTAICGRPMANP